MIHDAFPGQFIHLFRHLHRAGGNEIVAASRKGSTIDLPIKQIVYDVPAVEGEAQPQGTAAAIALGHDLYSKLKPLADDGWQPDCILTHASRGASYFIRELFPKARITTLLEWYYRDPAVGSVRDARAFYRACASNCALNAVIARDFDQADAVYAATQFQKGQFPARWQAAIDVCHEGIDTNLYSANHDATLTVGDTVFDREMEIITYAARGMEKSRGFPQFMLAIAEVQKQRPDLHVIIAAKDRICYDPGGRGKKGYKKWAEQTAGYDPARTHFVGLLPEREFARMLQISRLHVYLSIPFVLSWSCLNAMAAGVPVLASDNDPVREVITDGVGGLLVDPNNVAAISERIVEMLDDQKLCSKLATNARQSILDRFELAVCLKRQLDFIHG